MMQSDQATLKMHLYNDLESVKKYWQLRQRWIPSMDLIKNQSLMLMAIRFSSVLLIFSSSMFEVLNPNYSNSLDFHDQETFQPENTTSTILATGQKEDLRQPFESSTKRDYSRY